VISFPHMLSRVGSVWAGSIRMREGGNVAYREKGEQMQRPMCRDIILIKHWLYI
jgi:hypothetical protein